MKKVFKLLLSCLTLLGALTACKNTPVEPAVGDANWIDYVHNGSVKLNLDYKGHDFYKDGIGEVTLKCCIDGDTSHFYPVVKTTSSAPIKSRYYGIDTPESTGRIQEYGQEASNYNKERIKAAAQNGTIVVSSPQMTYGAPNADSTGERYVSLVWINETKKNAPYDELTLLNLEMVQYGYSWAKNVLDMPAYADTFLAAETQARNYKLNLFSGKPAPLFPYGDYVPCSILDLKYATENYLKDPLGYQSEWDGKKVRIRGTVAGFNDGTMYIQSYFDEEASKEVRGEGNEIKGGEYASINIFCGMSEVYSRYKVPNTYIEVCAVAKYSENFGFQLTGAEGHFKQFDSLVGDDDVKIILKADENDGEQILHKFEYTPQELSSLAKNNSYECLNCAVKLTEPVTVKRVIVSANEKELTLEFENCVFEAYINFLFKDPDNKLKIWNKAADFVGKSFMLDGIYGYHQVSESRIYYQFLFSNQDGIQLVK